MPSFAEPRFLLLLLLIPALVWCWFRQRSDSLRHSIVVRAKGSLGGRAFWVRRGGALLRGLLLFTLVVALAGPRWPDQRTRIDTEGIALQIVVDLSGSMAELDFSWDGQVVTRLDAVRRTFRLFLEGGAAADGTKFEGRARDLVGLVTFGTRPVCLCPLTLSHAPLLRLFEDLQPLRIPGESETNVSDALILGLHRLEQAPVRHKALVLLSDGEHNVATPSSGFSPRQVAQVARNLGVRVHTIDCGGEGLAPPEAGAGAETASQRELGRRMLTETAHIAGGKSFTAPDTTSLVEVLQQIDALERDPITSFQYRRYREGYPWFALAGLILAVLLTVLERTVWLRLP